jgi:hypothetical protein
MQFDSRHSFARAFAFAFAGMALALAPGCGDDGGDNNPPDAAPDAMSDAAPEVDAPVTNNELSIDRSILIRDQETLTAADFSMRRTVEAMLATSDAEATTPEDLLGSLLATFNDSSRVNPDSNLAMPVDVRPGEADLPPAALLDAESMKIIGIFNRFDRIPADGTHCGSARLVYGMPSNDGNTPSMILLFDAVVPNPALAQGREGCRVVAEFWAGLSALDDAQERAQALETFFYVGTDSLPAVVQFDSYSAVGAIISDHFINDVKWQLRPFNAVLDANNVPIIKPVRTGNAPLTEFYDSSFDPAAAGDAWANTDPELFAAERASFQEDFITAQLPRLIAPELSDNPRTAQSMILGFGVATGARYSEFQNDSEGDTDNPAVLADATFRDAITAALGDTGLSVDNVLDRAGAHTCGGCHSFAVGKQIGVDSSDNPVFWPAVAPGGFVHINQAGEISDLLATYWLPDRLAKLNAYLSTSSRVGVSGAPSCDLNEVKATKAVLLASKPGSERQTAYATYESAIERVRACEAALPGALTRLRLPH